MDKSLFIQLVESQQAGLRRFLLALCCGNGPEADDIAQETYLKAWTAADSVPADARQFAAWVHRTAWRTFLDHSKRSRRQEDLDQAHTLAADSGCEADAAFRHQELHGALAALPAPERTAVLLFHMQGYTTREIAHITDSSEDAVRKRLSRAREHLRSLIANP